MALQSKYLGKAKADNISEGARLCFRSAEEVGETESTKVNEGARICPRQGQKMAYALRTESSMSFEVSLVEPSDIVVDAPCEFLEYSLVNFESGRGCYCFRTCCTCN
jgi:hypothetical protein